MKKYSSASRGLSFRRVTYRHSSTVPLAKACFCHCEEQIDVAISTRKVKFNLLGQIYTLVVLRLPRRVILSHSS